MKNHFIGYLLSLGMLVSCNMSVSRQGNSTSDVFKGDYVTPDYNRRADGYDWTVVSIRPRSDTTAGISVRSRADLKKPSCTFDGTAYLSKGGDTLISMYEDSKIYFTLSSDTLMLSSETPELLHFFCSGGEAWQGNILNCRENWTILSSNKI